MALEPMALPCLTMLLQNTDDLIFGEPTALHLWSSWLGQSLPQTGLGAGGNVIGETCLTLAIQQGNLMRVEQFDVSATFCRPGVTGTMWNGAINRNEPQYTAAYDILAKTTSKAELAEIEAKKDQQIEYARFMIAGLCLHLNEPKDGHTNPRIAGANPNFQTEPVSNLPATTIHIKLGDNGLDTGGKDLRNPSKGRKKPIAHWVSGHLVRRRNGTTYYRPAFIRGDGPVIKQTRKVADDADHHHDA